ncbi:MAG: polysaccharide deacetylase family protein, partial [Gammaproteobacteria bacterium]|nr:polysaccharide deacetylase family protein [Gammaproteobacteria bacterium]
MNILTFDIEEWFHILDNDSTRGEESWRKFPSRIHGNVERILTMLDDRGQRATFFCLGWVAQEYPDIVRKISSGGHEIGTHSNLHQLVYEQKIEDFEDDIKKSISILEDVLGEKVLSYRAPGFSIKRGNERVFEILVENGIQVDSSIFPVKRAHGGYSDFGVARPVMVDYKGARLKEFPINSYRAFFKEIIFSGGGYFRFFPYWKIRR